MLAWMAYVVVVTALLSLAAYAAERSAQLRGARTRWLWGAAIIASLVLPSIISSVSIQIPRFSSAIASAPASKPFPLRQITSPALQPSAWLDRGPAKAAASPIADVMLKNAWAAVSLGIFLVILIAGANLFLGKRRWERQVVAGANVYVSEDVGPAVVGLLRPSIVVPRWITHAAPEAQALVLAHEQAHMDARDPQLLAIAILLIVTMPWNLPLWWQLRRLRFAIEMDCDARVLKNGYDVRRYGETLLMVGERQSANLIAVAAMSESKSFLEQRLRTMTAKRKGLAWGSATVMACLGVVLAAGAAEVCPPNAANTVAPSLGASVDTVVMVDDSPRASAPAPDKAAPLARHVMVNPHVLVLPTPAQMAAALPRDSVPLGVNGFVRIRCTVLRTGELSNCSVVEESPLTAGFGQAALKLAPDVKMTPRTIDGVPVDGAIATVGWRFVMPATERQQFAVDPGVLDEYVGHYQMGQTQLLVAVAREGSHLSVQMTGERAGPAYASGPNAFFCQTLNARFEFIRGGSGQATALVMHQNGQSIPMARIDEGAAEQISRQVQVKVTSQMRSPGTEEALIRLADGVYSGQPDYDDLIPKVAAHVREELPRMRPWLANYGPIVSIKFLGVGPMGRDVFDVVQAQGITHWTIELNSSGQIIYYRAAAGP